MSNGLLGLDFENVCSEVGRRCITCRIDLPESCRENGWTDHNAKCPAPDRFAARSTDIGADDFVDIEQAGWETVVNQVDLVYDAIGGEVLVQSAAIVKPGGALVSVMAPTQTDRTDIRTSRARRAERMLVV